MFEGHTRSQMDATLRLPFAIASPLRPHDIVPRRHAHGHVGGPILEEFDYSIGARIDASDPDEVILPSRVRDGYPPGAVRLVCLRWARRISDSGSIRE